MRILGIVALGAALSGCAASRQEVATRLGDQYVGQNVDALVVKFGPPASTFKMNSGDTSYIWQLGNQTNINTDQGSGIASTRFCKVSVIASKTGVVSQLNTEDSNAGAGLAGAMACTAASAQTDLEWSGKANAGSRGHPPLDRAGTLNVPGGT
jgi:hypothetical protein